MHSAEAGPSLALHVRQCPKRPPDSLGGDCSASAESSVVNCTCRAKTGKTAKKIAKASRPGQTLRISAEDLCSGKAWRIYECVSYPCSLLHSFSLLGRWSERILYRARKAPASYSELPHSGTGLIPAFPLRENLPWFFAWGKHPHRTFQKSTRLTRLRAGN